VGMVLVGDMEIFCLRWGYGMGKGSQDKH